MIYTKLLPQIKIWKLKQMKILLNQKMNKFKIKIYLKKFLNLDYKRKDLLW